MHVEASLLNGEGEVEAGDREILQRSGDAAVRFASATGDLSVESFP
jgi:hypothetical protein